MILILPQTLLLIALSQCNALRYLVFNPRIGKSHIMQMGKLADHLAQAGHYVVNLQPVIAPVNVTGVSHPNVRTYPIDVTISTQRPDDTNMWTLPKLGALNNRAGINVVGNIFLESCQQILLNEQVFEDLKKERFDLGIAEYFCLCGVNVFAKLGLERRILVSGMALPLQFTANEGIPSLPSFVPDTINQFSTHGFWGRFRSQLEFWGQNLLFNRPLFGLQGSTLSLVDPQLDINVSCRPAYYNMQNELAKASYIWINTDELLDFPRPISHKYINIGGLGMKRLLANVKPLEKRFEDIYRKAAKGVVYMSFGSVAQSATMPDHYVDAIFGAFNEFPDIQFLWKYENASRRFPNQPSNVHLFDWLPQRELLLQPKTLAFLTHGGMNSITEAAYAGLPLLCIPLFGDQGRNARMVQRKGIAEVLDKLRLADKDAIVEAVRKVVEGPSYKQKAAALAEIIRNKPDSPEERVLKTAEFAAKYHIQPHLTLDGRGLDLIQFYNLDVLAFLFFTLSTVVFLLGLVLRRGLRVLLRKVKTE